MMEDYRAGLGVDLDRDHDDADRAAGRRRRLMSWPSCWRASSGRPSLLPPARMMKADHYG
jgi:hypothetical protein